MIILDTNVLSVLMRESPDQTAAQWLDRQPRPSIWTTSITVLEIQFGIAIMAKGRRRELLNKAFEKIINDILERRIAAFDTDAAHAAAELIALRQQKGRAGDLRDAMIAGIALSRRAILATRNTRHFNDLTIPIVNPWESKD